MLVTGFTLLLVVSAANPGGLDDTTVNTGTDTNHEAAVAATTATVAATADTAKEAATTNEAPATTTATTGETAHVTYNQWGFTGDQSIWEPPTLTTASTGSKSATSLAVPTVKNSTSDANKLQVFEKYSWKQTFMLGSVVGLTAILHAL